MTAGFINLNKPSGITSAAAINKIKRLVGVPCGHMGTLDPLASGVLPVGIGNASRLFDYFLSKQKTYIAEFTFGLNSDTLDVEGNLEQIGRIPTLKEIEEVVPSLVGTVEQIPPAFSAKRVNGKRGYELAREGKSFTLAPKTVNIYSIELISMDGPALSLRIECGGGTYIRSIARDMAAALNTFAIMSALKRVKSGAFTVESSVTLQQLEEDGAEAHIIKTEDVLPFPVIKCKNYHIFHGLPVQTEYSDGLYKIFDENGFYGIAEVKDGFAKIKTKLC